MSNPLPPGAIPKLYRQRDKTRREVGSWYCRIKKVPVNLRTQDYMLARDRAKEALEGKRDFKDERYFPMLAAVPANAELKTVSTETPQPKTQTSGTTDWAADFAAAASAGIKPDDVLPPPSKPDIAAIGPMSSTSDSGSSKDDKPPPIDGDSTKIDPAMLEGIVKQGAAMMVELQIAGQEWLLKRYGKVQAGQVPETAEARKVPAAIYEQWLRTMIPVDMPIPPWLAAPIICAAMTFPIQLADSKPLPKPEPKSPTGP